MSRKRASGARTFSNMTKAPPQSSISQMRSNRRRRRAGRTSCMVESLTTESAGSSSSPAASPWRISTEGSPSQWCRAASATGASISSPTIPARRPRFHSARRPASAPVERPISIATAPAQRNPCDSRAARSRLSG